MWECTFLSSGTDSTQSTLKERQTMLCSHDSISHFKLLKTILLSPLGINLWFPQRSLFFPTSEDRWLMTCFSPSVIHYIPATLHFLNLHHHSWVFASAVSSAWKTSPVISLSMCHINECSASFNSPQSTFSRLLKVWHKHTLYQSPSDDPISIAKSWYYPVCVCILVFYDYRM